MADPKLVELLRQGSEVWNRWREQQPDYNLIAAELDSVDLREADLSNADLREAVLSNADLREADLSNADLFLAELSNAKLSNANLSNAKLSNASLYWARLSNANLSGAILCCADLRGAMMGSTDLRNTDMWRADLNYAKLSGADLSGANLKGVSLFETDLKNTNWTHVTIEWTHFNNLDLRSVIGLETIKHRAPSIISIDTIYRSHGQIPESFLRGAGVPETFITNMRALVASMSPIDYYTCFISYSHQNEDFAKRLYADLQAEGVRCWFAEEDLKIGDHYHQRIDEAIRLYDKLILVLSDAAVQSAWVEREVVAAREKEDRQQREVLFPLRLDDAVMETNKAWAADVRRRWHIGDFTCWKDHDSYQQAFERLLRDLKAESNSGVKSDGE